MIQEIINYKEVLNGIRDLIEKSPYKKNYIINEVRISSPTFYRKLKTNSFTPDEAMRIIRLINPKEAYAYDLRQGLDEARDDFKNGRIHSNEEVFKKARAKLQ